ncbi:MAG: hypothetical protein K8953_05265 [Proteobacteria bacterium]|nr:hypothetical protein [Pseudomonadota bacterium]
MPAPLIIAGVIGVGALFGLGYAARQGTDFVEATTEPIYATTNLSGIVIAGGALYIGYRVLAARGVI